MRNNQTESSARSVRSDAMRNKEAVLKAALEVFETSGIDAPIREIAKHAGVGIGTIYRHFPHRSDLIAATLVSEIDTCVSVGLKLIADNEPDQALIKWIDFYIEFITKTQGLASALNSGEPALEALPNYFLEQLRPIAQNLLNGAINSNFICEVIGPDEFLCAVSALCAPLQCPEPPEVKKLVNIFIKGLRYDA